MKFYEVLNNYDEAAKMSNFRALIVKDPTGINEWPSDNMDMIYHPKSRAKSACELFGFSCKDMSGEKFIFTCDPEKLKTEMKAIPEDKRTSWLEDIKKAEQKIFEKFILGEVYGIIFETWNPDARDWKTVDVQLGFYGFDEVKDYFKTELKHPIDCICVDSVELGDVKLWASEYKKIEVADGLV